MRRLMYVPLLLSAISVRVFQKRTRFLFLFYPQKALVQFPMARLQFLDNKNRSDLDMFLTLIPFKRALLTPRQTIVASCFM